MDPTDAFFKATDQFGIAIAVLLLQAVAFAVAFSKEWIVAGKTHRAAIDREIAKADAWERLFRDATGFSEEQLKQQKMVLGLADAIAHRLEGKTP